MLLNAKCIWIVLKPHFFPLVGEKIVKMNCWLFCGVVPNSRRWMSYHSSSIIVLPCRALLFIWDRLIIERWTCGSHCGFHMYAGRHKASDAAAASRYRMSGQIRSENEWPRVLLSGLWQVTSPLQPHCSYLNNGGNKHIFFPRLSWWLN